MSDSICGLGRAEKNKCLFKSEIKILAEAFNAIIKNKSDKLDPNGDDLFDRIMQQTKCTDEMCVVDRMLKLAKGTEFESLIYRIRELAFKLEGPGDLAALLDSFILFRVGRQIAYNTKPPGRIVFGGVLTYDFNTPPATSTWAHPEAIVRSWLEDKWGQMHFIFNTDHRAGEGVHWTALAISPESGTIEYFDSYGELPRSGFVKGTPTSALPDGMFLSLMQEWINAVILAFGKINKHIKFTYNETTHQEDSDRSNCGPYCLLYLVWRAKKHTLDEINKSPISQEMITSMREKLYIPASDYDFPIPKNIE